MNKKKVSAIIAIFTIVFFGWYVYYNTSLTSITSSDLADRNVPIEKYFKCAREGEAARVHDSDINMPAHCCRGLKVKNALLKSDSTLWIPALTGDIETCI